MSQMEILSEVPGDYFLGLSYEPTLQGWCLHTEITHWSLSQYKRYLKILSDALEVLRSRGIVEVFALCDTEKEVKFDSLFGFRDTGLKATGESGNKMFILHLEV
jgi:hypothetical protein